MKQYVLFERSIMLLILWIDSIGHTPIKYPISILFISVETSTLDE